MASTKKNLRLTNFIDHRMRVDLKDGRMLRGQMLGFDRHMNIVLADAEEIRQTRRKNKSTGQLQVGEEKRVLGLIILRGGEVIACNAEGPPPADAAARLGTTDQKPAAAAVVAAAPGISRPAGRGAGLQGPAAGVGGPGFGGFPPQGFPGMPGFGRGGPPGFPGAPQGFAAPPGMPGFPGAPQGFPPAGRGYPGSGH